MWDQLGWNLGVKSDNQREAWCVTSWGSGSMCVYRVKNLKHVREVDQIWSRKIEARVVKWLTVNVWMNNKKLGLKIML